MCWFSNNLFTYDTLSSDVSNEINASLSKTGSFGQNVTYGAVDFRFAQAKTYAGDKILKIEIKHHKQLRGFLLSDTLNSVTVLNS